MPFKDVHNASSYDIPIEDCETTIIIGTVDKDTFIVTMHDPNEARDFIDSLNKENKFVSIKDDDEHSAYYYNTNNIVYVYIK